jgi:hypothetical protein
MPTIRIDDEVYAWLQSLARPFEDNPNSVLRRIAKLVEVPKMEKWNITKRNVRTATVGNTKTPQYVFRKPILSILKKLGGQAERLRVLKELEEAMEGQLTDYDKSDIHSGTIRWQKSAEWEVRVMRELRLLKPVSEAPRGVWALTAKGFKAASVI